MATKQEKEALAKMIKDVDNKWEAITIIWIYRQKEIKNWIIMIEFSVLLFMLLKYTTITAIIWKWINGFVK